MNTETRSKTQLTGVTLTGADDTIDPARLLEISLAHPMVEWGILIGSHDRHRFPSFSWISKLCGIAAAAGNRFRLSLHICGTHLKALSRGEPTLRAHVLTLLAFERCQLNFHAEKQGEISSKLCSSFTYLKERYDWNPEVIFQLDGENNALPVHCSSGMQKIAGLFDLSHGAGILPEAWPKTELSCEHFPIGYAGGLGPENLREQLPKIQAAAAGEYWIDMETKLFDGLQFSLPKCVEVLEIAEEFVKEAAAWDYRPASDYQDGPHKIVDETP